MITKHTIYVLTCDKCGRTYSQNEDDGCYMTWFYSRKEAMDDAKFSDWVKDGKCFYCPDCLDRSKKKCEDLIKKWKKQVCSSINGMEAENE